METNNKRFMIAIIIIIAMILMCIELPYSDKSIVQFIIPVIHFKTNGAIRGSLFLSGIIPLIGLIWGYIQIVRSNRLNRSKLFIFIVLFFLVVPVMTKSLEIIKSPIYMLAKGTDSIEIIESDLSLSSTEELSYLDVSIELKSYKTNMNEISGTIKLSDKLSEYLETTSYIIDDSIRIGYNQKETISDSIVLDFIDGKENDDLFYTLLFYEDYTIVLNNDESETSYRRNDTY